MGRGHKDRTASVEPDNLWTAAVSLVPDGVKLASLGKMSPPDYNLTW